MAKKFDINSLEPVKLKKGIRTFKCDAVEFMKNHKKVTQALVECIMEGDSEAFHEIMATYLSIVNKEELSRKSKIPIATIRRIAAGSNVTIDSLLKVTAAINKELAA